MSTKKPNPTEDKTLFITISNVDDFKKSNCKSYLKCMSDAAYADWEQFHCNNCEAFEEETNPIDTDALIRFGNALKNYLK